MRIVSVTHYFPSRKGGIEAVALEINRRLAERGHSVEWFASSEPNLPRQLCGVILRPTKALHIVEKLIGIPLPIWLSGDLRHLLFAIRSCDLVHVHDFIYPGSILATLTAAVFRKPVVLTQHIGEIPYEKSLLRHLLNVVNRTLGRVMLQHASRSVFISNAVEMYFRQFTNFSRPPLYIPNGVDREIFHPVSSEIRQELRSNLGVGASGKPVLLFVGRFVEKKGLALLSQIVARTPEIEWLFAGEGPMDPATWDVPNVRVFRGRRHETLAELYRAADLLVLPSRGEGFPLVVQEALACGTPVCISDETAAGCEAARPLIHELPVTGSDAAERWSSYVKFQTENLRTLRECRATLADFAQKTWSWDIAVGRYLELYAQEALPA